MSSNVQIYPEDGLKVLNLLKSVTNTSLPDYGLLAGQAVCSALLYLKGQDSQININDLDIFFPIHTDKDNLYAFNPHHEIPKRSSVYSSVNRIDRNNGDRQSWRSAYYKKHNKESNKSSHPDPEEYEAIEAEAYRLFPEKKENFWQFHESSYQLGYKILAVFKRGLKNIIFTKKPRGVYSDHKTTFSVDVEALTVLKGFDLNCVQVGIDLRTGKIFYTPEFVGFLHSKQLRILQPYRPWHTIIRYFQKKDCHGYYGNDELAIAITSTFHDLRTPELMQDLLDLEPDSTLNPREFYGHTMEGLSHDIPRFGNGYIDKYKSIQNLIRNHFELRVDSVKINKKTGEEYSEQVRNLPNLTHLGGLTPRYSGVGSVLGGSHRKALQKKLGLKIRNYPAYARSNLIPIIEDKFGLYGKKYESKRSSLLEGIGKPNSRKNPYFKEPFLKVLTDRGDLFQGDIYQEGLKKVDKLLNEHNELRNRFSVMSYEDQIESAKRLSWLEKHYPNFAFHIVSGNINISNFDIINLEDEDLIRLIEVSYESWKEKELSRPELASPLFGDINLQEGSVWATELLHSGFLIEEGNSQRHCVGGYGPMVKQGLCRIVSLRKNFHKRATMQLIFVNDEKIWEISQFRTKANRMPDVAFHIALREWIELMEEKGIKVRNSKFR